MGPESENCRFQGRTAHGTDEPSVSGNTQRGELKMRPTLMLLIVAITAQTVAAQKTQCTTNPSLSWTIHQSYTDPNTQIPYTSAIQGDSSAVYVDGSPGVIATLFQCSGQTGDATLTLGHPRTASISFSNILSTIPANTPSWASSGSTATGLLAMDVRNLAFLPAGTSVTQEYSFTTRFNTSVPESGSWGLHLLNPSPSAPSADGNGTVANFPYATYYDSLVNVQHCPANDASPVSPLCTSGTAETWVVWPDSTTAPPQVATLLNQKKNPGVNSGQFSIPFYFVISIK
jgi:hypothetical protein